MIRVRLLSSNIKKLSGECFIELKMRQQASGLDLIKPHTVSFLNVQKKKQKQYANLC